MIYLYWDLWACWLCDNGSLRYLPCKSLQLIQNKALESCVLLGQTRCKSEYDKVVCRDLRASPGSPVLTGMVDRPWMEAADWCVGKSVGTRDGWQVRLETMIKPKEQAHKCYYRLVSRGQALPICTTYLKPTTWALIILLSAPVISLHERITSTFQGNSPKTQTNDQVIFLPFWLLLCRPDARIRHLYRPAYLVIYYAG